MEINDGGVNLVVIKHFHHVNPFWVYRVWWDGGNRQKLITKFADLTSVIWYLTEIVPGEWSEYESMKEGWKNE